MGSVLRSLVVRYGVAVLAIAVALIVRLLLDPLMGDRLPFLISCLAVVMVAWHGGFGPSLLALLLGLLATTYFFLPPRYSLAASLAGHQLQVTGFLFLGVTIGLFSERLRVARHRAEAHAREAIRQRQELEQEVAQRKQLELKLQQRAEELAEADRHKDEFLAMLGHELRNPLAPIRHAVDVLRVLGPADSQLQWVREVIDRQCRQMAHLVEDLLDVSRIRRGKITLKKETVELAAVVRSAVETANPVIEASGHQLTVTLPPEPVLLEGDPVRLAQVFANLLTNAAKYTEKGGRIGLTAERQGSDVLVAVKDTGIGIAAEHLPRLFEMFAQMPRGLDRAQGGLGIGLSLVRGLVEMHGGQVEGRSEGVGKGSEFLVRLPVPLLPPLPEPSPPAGVKEATHRTRYRILVVDDNRDIVESLGRVLRLMGHETQAAHDGVEAVAAAEHFRPAIVLLDIGLPRLDGYETARRLRQQPWGRQMVLVAITGWGQEDDKRRASEAGFDHHLTKPVYKADLEQLLAGLKTRA